MKHVSILMEADAPNHVDIDELEKQLSSPLYTLEYGEPQGIDLEYAENLNIKITEKLQ